MPSRHIPTSVRKTVDKRDKYKCVWCGTKLMERHHIKEFHLGGGHTAENLIILCPNCHTIIHKGGIDPIELLIRRNDQTNSTRFGGNFSLSVIDPVTFEMGGMSMRRAFPGALICLRDKDILAYKIDNGGGISISCRFYDKNGQIIFWMYDNYYCTTGDFTVSVKEDSIRVWSEDGRHYVYFEKLDDNRIKVNFNTFINGKPLISYGSSNGKDSYVTAGNINVFGSGATFINIGEGVLPFFQFE